MDKVCVQYSRLYVPEVDEQMSLCETNCQKGGVENFQLKECLNKKKKGWGFDPSANYA